MDAFIIIIVAVVLLGAASRATDCAKDWYHQRLYEEYERGFLYGQESMRQLTKPSVKD